MSLQKVRTRTDGTPSYFQAVLLDGTYYILQFEWVDRAFRWYMSTYDADQALIVGALPLLVRAPLLRGTTTNLARPPGDFLLLDTSGQDKEAGLLDLGSRCILYYIPGAENPSL